MEILKNPGYKILLIAAILIGIAVIVFAQFSIPTLFDADGYYHIRMAKFITQYGPYLDFHWARYSILAEHFVDKDFLYHLLLIPFTFLPDMIFGAKIAAVVFAAALYLVFFLAFEALCRAAINPAVSYYFLYGAAFFNRFMLSEAEDFDNRAHSAFYAFLD